MSDSPHWAQQCHSTRATPSPSGLCNKPVVKAHAKPNRLIHIYAVAQNGTGLANRRVFL